MHQVHKKVFKIISSEIHYKKYNKCSLHWQRRERVSFFHERCAFTAYGERRRADNQRCAGNYGNSQGFLVYNRRSAGFDYLMDCVEYNSFQRRESDYVYQR